METPFYDELNFTQRMAVRHAVLAPRSIQELLKEPGALEKALETIASDPDALKRAVETYTAFAKQQAAKIGRGME